MARSNKGNKAIHERVQFLPKKQKPHRATSWQINA